METAAKEKHSSCLDDIIFILVSWWEGLNNPSAAESSLDQFTQFLLRPFSYLKSKSMLIYWVMPAEVM